MSAGIYEYTVAPADNVGALLERFDLCSIDIELSEDGRGLHPRDKITVKRHMQNSSGDSDLSEFHRGWKCTYPNAPRSQR